VVRRRLKSKKELLDYTIEKYAFYTKIFNEEHSGVISKFYLKDFLTDLLLIQRYADRKEDDEDNS
jgi:hypothetical protein